MRRAGSSPSTPDTGIGILGLVPVSRVLLDGLGLSDTPYRSILDLLIHAYATILAYQLTRSNVLRLVILVFRTEVTIVFGHLTNAGIGGASLTSTGFKFSLRA